MPTTRASRKRLAEALSDVDGLENEMKLLAPGAAMGSQQPRRKPNRKQYNERRKIRKMLETHEEAPQGEQNTGRLRGSKAATGDMVIARSLIFGDGTSNVTSANNDGDEEDSFEGEENDKEEFGVDEEQSDGDDDDDDDGSTNSVVKRKATKKGIKTNKTRAKSSGRSRKRSRIQRMKSFRSAKMAERHGEALSAHIRGKPALAIRKLKRLAKDVPSAPQVYSSLGMIYHDLFLGSKQKEEASMDKQRDGIGEFVDDDHELPEQNTQNNMSDKFQEQLEYAKKAYASYHISACLCKRDAALWQRSGDAALDVAAVHSSILIIPNIGQTINEFHRAEKQRWLEEAKNDFQSADTLNPPGAALPIKLAQVMIELGLLSDALTLLTDVKEREDFIESYEGWQLYADLMLRIGYECKLWNEGTHTNEHYMFRRWLRKHSKTFDWEERRLQALVKALEAASGTKHCISVISWMKERAVRSRKEQPTNNTADDTNEDQTLLERSTVEELAAFDKTTSEMELSHDSLEAKERKQARDAIVLRHSTMRSDHIDCPQGLHSKTEELLPQENPEPQVKKFTASIRTIRAIALELMRSLLALDLHIGARLVGEAVSSYLADRMTTVNAKPRNGSTTLQEKSTTSYAMDHKSYDEGTNSECDDGYDIDDQSCHLSDDEELEILPVSELEKLQKGVLPPDIRFLYGISLAQQGSFVLASHCLKAIDEFPFETSNWLEETDDHLDEPEWIRQEFSTKELFTRSIALACLSDTLNSVSLTEILRRTGPIYQQQVTRLRHVGLVDNALSKDSTEPRLQLRRAVVVKVLMTNLYYQLDLVGDETNVQTLAKAVESVSFVLDSIWKTNKIQTRSTTIIDLMSAFEKTVNFCADSCDFGVSGTDRLQLTYHLARPIGLLCDVPDLRLDDIACNDGDFKSFPIYGKWLSRDLWPVALRSFNLCVATNVSQFSGWEKEEFSLRLLRQNKFPSFFGITMETGHVAGFLGEKIENKLISLWELVEDKVTDAKFDFKRKIEEIRKSDWYNKIKDRQFAAEAKNPIVHEAEDKALSSFLRFSQMCLEAFNPSSTETKPLLHVALSIILPMSQFVLNHSLWDIPIGRAAPTSSFRGWSSMKSPVVRPSLPSKRPGYRRPKRIEETQTNPSKDLPLDHIFDWEKSKNLSENAIHVPLPILMKNWSGQISQPSGEVNLLMKEVHIRMKEMRSCYSVHSSSKIALDIADLLIKIVSTGSCQNPFLCIHQAALFASQAPKHGTGDQRFHKILPTAFRCTEVEAISIIGRADCLRALHFFEEAAFLCSFVAELVWVRRKSQSQWTNRWNVLGVLTYDLSVAIRDTMRVIQSQGSTRFIVDEFCWKSNVIEALQSSRNDGIKMTENDPTFRSETNNASSDFSQNLHAKESQVATLGSEDRCFNEYADDEEIDNEFSHIEIEAV